MKANEEKAVQQERILNAVLSKYEGVKDICIQNAVKEWQKERFDPQETEPMGELFHTVTSPEMEQHAVAWHHADIEDNAALARARLARVKLDEARSRFVSALAESEGVYANSEDMHVLISRMEVWKVDGDRFKRALPRKVIAFCLAVVNGELNFDDLRARKFPKTFKDLQVIQEFVNDLLNFCDESGETARQQIKGVCENMTLAHKVADDTDMTQPVRFLAEQVVKSRSPQASLLQRGSGIGFGAGLSAG
ncbi:MAG: hypothetical protein WCK89_05460 [bacterium]